MGGRGPRRVAGGGPAQDRLRPRRAVRRGVPDRHRPGRLGFGRAGWGGPRPGGAGVQPPRPRPVRAEDVAERLRRPAAHRELLRVLVRTVPEGNPAAGQVLPHRARQGGDRRAGRERRTRQCHVVHPQGGCQLSGGLRSRGHRGLGLRRRGPAADVLPRRQAPHRRSRLRRGHARRHQPRHRARHGRARPQVRRRASATCWPCRPPRSGRRPRRRATARSVPRQ